MNKALLPIATLMAIAHSAQAQSAVTIYGVADVGIQIDRGSFAEGGSRVSQISGGNTGSRLGFRGREDLGGGLSALFDLQMGINIDNGSIAQNAIGFGRTAFVAMASSRLGTARLGRIDSALYAHTWKYDPMGDALGGAFTRLVTLTSTHRRQDNTIDYASPKFGGFSGQASYSFGEAAGSMAAGRRISAAIGYDNGPLSLAIAHQSNNSLPSGSAPIVTTRLSAVGGSYAFGSYSVRALYQTNKSNAALALDTDDLMLGGTARWDNHALSVSWIRHSDKTPARADARQVAVGYMYFLSKRTNLYMGASRITNEGNARFGLAPLTAGGAPSANSPKVLVAGVRHFF